MNRLLRLFRWLLKAAVFFTLFAFALNNQQDVVVHFFFGHDWRAPLVLVVLSVFALGVAVGVLGMLPWWWRQRRAAEAAVLAASLPAPTRPDKAPAGNGVTPASAPAYADGI